MMMILDRNAALLQQTNHLGTQGKGLIARWDRMVPAMDGDEVSLTWLTAVPVGFTRIQPVGGGLYVILNHHPVKNIEL